MFRTSPGPSSGGTTGMQDAIQSCTPVSQLYTITSTKCRINTFVPLDGPGEVRNMLRL